MSLDLIYFDTAFAAAHERLPGTALYAAISASPEYSADREYLHLKLEQACRKLCLMWQAGDWAKAAETEFWTSTIREAPALFGSEAVTVHYHLEAFVLFARSALDVASTVFGRLLPAPFPRNRYDSFNRLLKAIEKSGPSELQANFRPLRESDTSWVSVLSGSERGRSLRDKVSHQTDFPLDYAELNPSSEKEYAVVVFGDGMRLPLNDFLQAVRNGTVEGFQTLEDACVCALHTA